MDANVKVMRKDSSYDELIMDTSWLIISRSTVDILPSITKKAKSISISIQFWSVALLFVTRVKIVTYASMLECMCILLHTLHADIVRFFCDPATLWDRPVKVAVRSGADTWALEPGLRDHFFGDGSDVVG